jgi:hypothetical protein
MRPMNESEADLEKKKKDMIRSIKCLAICVEPDIQASVAERVKSYTDALELANTKLRYFCEHAYMRLYGNYGADGCENTKTEDACHDVSSILDEALGFRFTAGQSEETPQDGPQEKRA